VKQPLSKEEYADLLNFQCGVCAICKRPPRDVGPLLAVDHHHGNGEIRGLLCGGCNVTLGILMEDTDWMRSAADYLDWPPTRDLWIGLPRWWPNSPGAAGHDLRERR